MTEVTAMETMEMLQKFSGEIAWGPLLDFENDWSTNHWGKDSKLLDLNFDPRKPETVKEYLSKIYDKPTDS